MKIQFSFSRALMITGLCTLGAAAMLAQRNERERTTGVLRLSIVDGETGRPTPARVEVLDEKGKGHIAEDALLVGGDCHDHEVAWKGTLEQALALLSRKVVNRYSGTDQFYSGGHSTVSLTPGIYKIKVQKGLEYRVQTQEVRVRSGHTTELAIELSRWSNLPAQGWYGSDSHLHIARPLKELNPYISKWMQAEDIHVANLLEWGHSKRFHNAIQYAHGTDGLYQEGNYLLAPGQENPRTHFLGHTLILGASKKINYPDSYIIYKDFWDEARQQEALSGFCHFAVMRGGQEGLAIDLLDDLLSFIEVVSNDSGVYDVWYQALNLGIRLTPIAGTDYPCGPWQLPGRERFYTHVKGPLNYRAWLEGVRHGRTFVTNGPLIGFGVNGRGLGEEVMLKEPGRVHVEGWVRFDPTRDDVEQLEVVQNGEVVRSFQREGESAEIRCQFWHEVTEAAWFSLRASGKKRTEALSPFNKDNYDAFRRGGAQRTEELSPYSSASPVAKLQPNWKPGSPSLAHTAAIYVTLENAPGLSAHPRARTLALALIERLDNLEMRLAPERIRDLASLRWRIDGVGADDLLKNREALLARIRAAKKSFADLVR